MNDLPKHLLNNQQQSGLTLLELLIVLSIIAILLSFGIGLLINNLQQLAVREAESVFLRNVEALRSQVFQSQTTAFVEVLDNQKGYIIFADSPNRQRIALPKNINVTFKYAKGKTFKRLGYYPPYAEVSAVNSIVEFDNGNYKRTLYILGVTGKVVRK